MMDDDQLQVSLYTCFLAVFGYGEHVNLLSVSVSLSDRLSVPRTERHIRFTLIKAGSAVNDFATFKKVESSSEKST